VEVTQSETMAHLRKSLSAGLSVLFLLANPAYFAGCAENQREMEFGEAEMLELMAQLNAEPPMAVELPSSMVGYRANFELVQSVEPPAKRAAMPMWLVDDWIVSAHACSGDRDFFAEAEACVDTTTLHLEGAVRLEREGILVAKLPVTGAMDVSGYALDHANIRLDAADGHIWLKWNAAPDEGFHDLEVEPELVSEENLGGASGASGAD
jgi:hypothetical protein